MFKYSFLRETSDSMSHFRTKVSLILRFYFLASQLVSLILPPKTQTAPFGWRTRTSDSISKHKNKQTFTWDSKSLRYGEMLFFGSMKRSSFSVEDKDFHSPCNMFRFSSIEISVLQYFIFRTKVSLICCFLFCFKHLVPWILRPKSQTDLSLWWGTRGSDGFSDV